MHKKILSFIVSLSMTAGISVPFANASYAAMTVSSITRQMEYLDRGLIAIKVSGGVYLS